MNVDLDQLPIPDWGLKCPRCAYALRGLPSHRCPECGEILRMSELVRPWTRLRPPTYTGAELPMPDFGMRCRRCDSPLAGASTLACPVCGHMAKLQESRPRDAWFPVDDGLGELPRTASLDALLLQQGIPHIRSENRAGSDVLLARGVGAGILYVSSEFYFDYLALIQTINSALTAPNQPLPDWSCAACGETCPGNFETCWNCGVARHEALQSDSG